MVSNKFFYTVQHEVNKLKFFSCVGIKGKMGNHGVMARYTITCIKILSLITVLDNGGIVVDVSHHWFHLAFG